MHNKHAKSVYEIIRSQVPDVATKFRKKLNHTSFFDREYRPSVPDVLPDVLGADVPDHDGTKSLADGPPGLSSHHGSVIVSDPLVTSVGVRAHRSRRILPAAEPRLVGFIGQADADSAHTDYGHWAAPQRCIDD